MPGLSKQNSSSKTLFLDVLGCLVLPNGTYQEDLADAVSQWLCYEKTTGKSDVKIIVWSSSPSKAEKAAVWLAARLNSTVQAAEKTSMLILQLTPKDIMVDDAVDLLKVAKARGIEAMTPEEFIRIYLNVE